MNHQQKKIVLNFSTVIICTIVAVVGMVCLKDWVNRSEAMRAMTLLNQAVEDYRSKYKSVPPESYIENIKQTIQARARINDFNYRARWIDFENQEEEILAFIEQNYHTFIFKKTVLILKLDGTIKWMGKKEFQTLLEKQQTPLEKLETSKK